MNKNTVIGFILIFVIFFGFTWYQSSQYKKQVEYQAQQDSIARAEQAYADSVWRAEHPEDTLSAALSSAPDRQVRQRIYRDSLLDVAHEDSSSYVTLANDKVEIVFNTKGAQPYSVLIKDYKTYDSTDLYLIKPGMSQYGITIYAGENISTKDFVFSVAESTDSTLVMRLPFSGGGYIEQKYTLEQGSYMMKNYLSFVGMGDVIPRNVSMFDIDWNVVIPRLEKGYRNEMQYSKLDYCYPGEKKPEQLGRGGRSDEERVDSKVNWFAFQQQFFSAIMRAGEDFSSAAFGIKFFEEDDPERNLMVCYADMRSEFDLSAGGDVTIPYEFYFGPNHYRTLKSYDQHYERIIPLGGSVIGLISRWVIIPVFNFLGRFIENFGIIILLLTVLIKLVVSPLTMKSYISSAKMSVLKPEMDKLNEKYPRQEDALKKQQAMMNLYRRAGVSPMGGCLPMLLQLPILYAMFRFFPASIELRQQPFLWADDLSAYDSILNLPFNIPLYGDHVSLFALLMALSMFIYSKMTSSQMSSDPSMAGMKFMSVWLMPIMMLFICNNLSSGLSYYYLLSNLITMLQTWFVKRYVVKPEKIHALLAATEGKPMPKSKWQQRLEEAQKMQQQMAKEQARRRR
ncbi:MAG: membrane protein insertase YidC [Bacteroidetes bacterium]|uniref:Membrane protein insertase YidC n=1 Tax=Candidatus Cryptobacteroides excrementavium TaxID=2840759 RepID=A0A9D9J3T4_9BACT|nr:membrane protein insertase YidC [Candidatus Cryptobacteroides excrementavium]